MLISTCNCFVGPNSHINKIGDLEKKKVLPWDETMVGRDRDAVVVLVRYAVAHGAADEAAGSGRLLAENVQLVRIDAGCG